MFSSVTKPAWLRYRLGFQLTANPTMPVGGYLGLLVPIPKLGGSSPLSPTSNSWIPEGCPRIQLNSDTIYLEIKSPYKTTPHPTSDTSRTGGSNNPLQLRMPIANPGCYLYFWPIGYIKGFHNLLLRIYLFARMAHWTLRNILLTR